jgi:hypothetical protein
MPESVPPPVPAPASSRRLIRSTLIAAAIASVILVTIVLPAEYGIDYTGVGRILGLKEMGETKVALAKEDAAHAAEAAAVAAEPASTPASPAESAVKTEVADLTLLPDEGKEIKLVMRKDARVTYAWTTNRGVVNYDTHADSPTIKYHGYAKGERAKADSGSLTAAFDGNHGWYWRNRSTDTVVVSLRVAGDFQELKRMQ